MTFRSSISFYFVSCHQFSIMFIYCISLTYSFALNFGSITFNAIKSFCACVCVCVAREEINKKKCDKRTNRTIELWTFALVVAVAFGLEVCPKNSCVCYCSSFGFRSLRCVSQHFMCFVCVRFCKSTNNGDSVEDCLWSVVCHFAITLSVQVCVLCNCNLCVQSFSKCHCFDIVRTLPEHTQIVFSVDWTTNNEFLTHFSDEMWIWTQLSASAREPLLTDLTLSLEWLTVRTIATFRANWILRFAWILISMHNQNWRESQ